MAEVESICQQVVIIAKGRLRLHRRLKDLEADAPIMVEVRGSRDQVVNQIKNVEGVAKVKHESADGEVHLYQVLTKQSKDLREVIAQRLVSNGFGVRRLERRASLRDYFEDLMGEGETSPPPAPHSPPGEMTAPVAPSEAVKA
jgi:ABC-2 type transport system ATP-binding protein